MYSRATQTFRVVGLTLSSIGLSCVPPVRFSQVTHSRSCLVLPLERFDSEGWFSSEQVIFLTVFRVFLVKKHAAFKCKDAISGFSFSPGSAEALVRCGGKIKYILIAYFLGNICAKNCRNRTVYVKIIAGCKGGTFFETR